MKKITIIIGFILANIAFGQVAIGKTSLSTLADNITPNPSISLEFGSGNKGLILPWVNSASAVTSEGVVPGTIIYDTTDHKVKIKKASAWKDLSLDDTGVADTTLQDGLTDAASSKVAIGTNGSTDATPGILVLTDTDKGMILPKVASPHLNIVNPAAGMIVYDTATKQLAVFDGTVWSFWKQ